MLKDRRCAEGGEGRGGEGRGEEGRGGEGKGWEGCDDNTLQLGTGFTPSVLNTHHSTPGKRTP